MQFGRFALSRLSSSATGNCSILRRKYRSAHWASPVFRSAYFAVALLPDAQTLNTITPRLFATRGFPPTRAGVGGRWPPSLALAPVHPRCSRRLGRLVQFQQLLLQLTFNAARRRRMLRIPRFRLTAKALSLRCSASPGQTRCAGLCPGSLELGPRPLCGLLS